MRKNLFLKLVPVNSKMNKIYNSGIREAKI